MVNVDSQRHKQKVPLVSGSHTKRLRLGEALVGALGVACLFLAINNLRTQKPNQNKKYNQYLLG